MLIILEMIGRQGAGRAARECSWPIYRSVDLLGAGAGRIIRPARHYARRNHRSKWPEHYTTAIYSDDGDYRGKLAWG